MAKLFADIYRSTLDDRYYEPAVILAAQALDPHPDTLRAIHAASKPFTGHLERGIVDALVHLHDQDIQSCYELALGTTPTWTGTVTVTLDIATTGAVTRVALDPGHDPPLLADCVAARARAGASRRTTGPAPHT